MENTSLAVIQQHPEKYTMLIPIETVSQIPEIMAPTIKAVKISTDLNDKEIYVQEKAKGAYRDRNGTFHEATPPRYALTKRALTKLAEASGIKQVDCESVLPTICQKCVSVNQHSGGVMQCGNCQSNQDVRYKVTIAVPQLTGETLYFVDHHEINVRDVIADMTESQKKEFLKHRAQICEAKALNGAIRTALQIKGSYLIEEFEKPFVVGYLVPNLDNNAVKRVAIESMFQSRGNLFGRDQKKAPMEAPVIDCRNDAGMQDYGDVIDTPDIRDTHIETYSEPQRLEVQTPVHDPGPAAPVPDPDPPEDRSQDFCCDKCGKVIPRKVWDYSYENFGRPLCYDCQKIVRGQARQQRTGNGGQRR